ncbi:MAG: hypothetical protein IJP68_05065, partial [Selenomonadaceae bacterium]|nr:hypothetical protein [Selenomonadaceae bacterium]
MSIQTRRANATNVIGSSLNAKNIDLSTTNGQTGSNGILSKMYNATLAATGVSVGYNNVETNGSGEINIAGSNLNVGKNSKTGKDIEAGENINVTATDNSKSKSYILDAGLDIIGYTGVFAYNTNTSQTGIEVNYNSALNAKNINFDTQNHTHRATDTMAISAGVAGVQTNTSEAKDTSKNFIAVKGEGNSFTADTLNFNALNGSQLYAYNNGQGYKVLNVIVVNGLANANTTSDISIADGNTFKADTVNLTSQVGEVGKKTSMAEGYAINVAGIGVSVDSMTAKTESTASVNVGNEFFNDDTTLNVSALNKASRDSFMRNNAYALGINANQISAYTKAKDKAEITIGSDTELANSNKLGVLNITSDSDNKSYVAAKGTGGAIIGTGGLAAHAENAVDNTSSATLKGTWEIADNLTLSANQHDSAYISGYSARGAIFTSGKGLLDNKIKGSSTATIAEGATINAKTVNINSKNYIKTDKYSNDYDYTLFGRMGGVVDDADKQISKATMNKSANINIGKNATIQTPGTQTYDALSNYDLQNKVHGEGGSLLLSLHWADSDNYITANENINVGEGALLKNEGGLYEDSGITLAAHDNLKFNFRAKGYAQAGVAGYVGVETLTDLKRNSTITINGTLNSAKDLNLYAGADTNGEGSKVNSYSESVTESNTVIPASSVKVSRSGKTTSNVNINSGAYGEAKHDVNIISNAGYETYDDHAFAGTLWGKGEHKDNVSMTELGNVTGNGYTHSKNVKVDGSLKAGSVPNATIKISGVAVPDDFLLVDKNAKNLSYSVTSGNETVTKKNTNFKDMTIEEAFAQYVYNGITTGMIRPEDSLIPRYKEIETNVNEYGVNGRNDIVAYNSLLQEKKSLEEELEKLGMGSYNAGGEFLLDQNPSIGIKTLVLPNVEVSGGSINVSTGSFSGSGKLNASGVPQIDIENDSTAYLVANKLTIADKGGNVIFNGKTVASNSDIGGDAKFA